MLDLVFHGIILWKGCVERCGLSFFGKPTTAFCPISKGQKEKDMKWLTKDWIKKHSRIDFDCEDELLELYGNAAENGILRLLNRSWEDVRENLSDEDINGSLMIAGLLLTEHLYTHRGPIENVQPYQIPYNIDFYIKPFMRLVSNNYEQTNTQGYGKCKNL